MTKQEMIDHVRSLADALSDMAAEAEGEVFDTTSLDYIDGKQEAYALAATLLDKLGDDFEGIDDGPAYDKYEDGLLFDDLILINEYLDEDDGVV